MNIESVPFYGTVSNFAMSAEVICSAQWGVSDVLRTLLLRKWQPWGTLEELG